eukprot:TRINITY_DN86705_c0_g1_i1.p1 TRINITY_DN86705_c0_g1~~TRINITY_DN86705_c0_g1_i1.p1  ORF type:complete len:258 (+),score=17.96 TRINITY_DN86705_c0_g1_i1:42-776(+)
MELPPIEPNFSPKTIAGYWRADALTQEKLDAILSSKRAKLAFASLAPSHFKESLTKGEVYAVIDPFLRSLQIKIGRKFASQEFLLDGKEHLYVPRIMSVGTARFRCLKRDYQEITFVFHPTVGLEAKATCIFNERSDSLSVDVQISRGSVGINVASTYYRIPVAEWQEVNKEVNASPNQSPMHHTRSSNSSQGEVQKLPSVSESGSEHGAEDHTGNCCSCCCWVCGCCKQKTHIQSDDESSEDD